IESATRFTEPSHPHGGRRGRRRWLLVVLLVAVLAGAGWVVGWSPLLSVTEVRVLGARTLSADQVRAAADVELGMPLARVPAAAVAERVEALPAVAGVEVRYGWPHVLVLVVTERVPVAVVAGASGTAGFELVDAAGNRYDTVAARPVGLPLLATTPAADGAALAVLTALPPELASRVARVRADTQDDVVLVLADGTRLRWGGATDSGRKAAVVLALLPRRAGVIDVSAPELPTTRGSR
ncbi:MAG TPA: FtsQ-type POTRA domain-containing protein, partial [Candidatus Nanopelagicales bacterium]|nr:FtsQ-type POTRA domain-containing protein [Candidatus Nanopelagicales bacterium]